MSVSVVPAEGRTSIRIHQRIRGLAAMVTASTLMAGAVAAPFIAVMADRLMSRPTPRWVRSLGIDLFIHHSDAQAIAIGIGALAIAAAIPFGRAINKLLARQQERRVRLLTEAVSANTRLAIDTE
jgi:hypothetical protein